jgi:hypothetical protein
MARPATSAPAYAGPPRAAELLCKRHLCDGSAARCENRLLSDGARRTRGFLVPVSDRCDTMTRAFARWQEGGPLVNAEVGGTTNE